MENRGWTAELASGSCWSLPPLEMGRAADAVEIGSCRIPASDAAWMEEGLPGSCCDLGLPKLRPLITICQPPAERCQIWIFAWMLWIS
ncbi:hypothetical protein ACLOJK_010436 [Asimina triloba]